MVCPIRLEPHCFYHTTREIDECSVMQGPASCIHYKAAQQLYRSLGDWERSLWKQGPGMQFMPHHTMPHQICQGSDCECNVMCASIKLLDRLGL